MKIDVFDLNSVNSAISELKKQRDKLENDLKNSVKELTQKGYEYMLSIMREDTGNLKTVPHGSLTKQNKKV